MQRTVNIRPRRVILSDPTDEVFQSHGTATRNSGRLSPILVVTPASQHRRGSGREEERESTTGRANLFVSSVMCSRSLRSNTARATVTGTANPANRLRQLFEPAANRHMMEYRAAKTAFWRHSGP